ncbi:flagellar basal body-associated FliL family protein [Entomospira culicis]|uniref:Flagellar protein FliL n=1 Tax=Entomospira culicis TaxID=2719989 RepID=A0A968GEC1_9SPIO|nr:flagellar basal body-associated FliL family protein [Entomospira culicis]NIZ18496.1 hypothetical protein [Entomospira culicis]NIZ68712.1 hypothetical protein [Entomospira culicis]WDI37310.1 flagellar basal body-associated FliL family protein [Entomospira culicis]WDI38939.1 flagellar basal body-associated FliL family protein [Entomospira culicis]
MSDTNLMNDMDDVAEAGGKKKKGRLSLGGSMAGGIIKILAFIAGIIGAILFIVVVSVITYNVMDKGAQTQALQDASEIYHPPGNHEYADVIKVRGRTSDRVGRTFMIDVRLGYRPGDEKTIAELARRTPQLQDLLRQFFSSQKVENLTPEREDALKAELRNQVNNILSQGQVTDVIFTEKIIDFS